MSSRLLPLMGGRGRRRETEPGTQQACPGPPCLPRRKPVPLPSQVPGVTSVVLHPLLAQSSCTRTRLCIDFASPHPHPPSFPFSTNSTPSNAPSTLAEPATFPGLPSLTIECRRLPWVIIAHAGRGGRWVTVADVIEAIWDALGRQVDRGEFADSRVGGVWKPRTSWMALNSPRVIASQTSRMTAWRYGMTRLDLLQGRTKFGGLSESESGCETWIVEFE
ncbi:hypothetical protein R3P38DRAFT_3083333 [Favolaschia claudopus]|uniref:DUF6699 domain-containing protein n=1 Tax=Favolaschia claudopus TaxID=2862362 RepID=A0AAV9ZV52_9AGAR